MTKFLNKFLFSLSIILFSLRAEACVVSSLQIDDEICKKTLEGKFITEDGIEFTVLFQRERVSGDKKMAAMKFTYPTDDSGSEDEEREEARATETEILVAEVVEETPTITLPNIRYNPDDQTLDEFLAALRNRNLFSILSATWNKDGGVSFKGGEGWAPMIQMEQKRSIVFSDWEVEIDEKRHQTLFYTTYGFEGFDEARRKRWMLYMLPHEARAASPKDRWFFFDNSKTLRKVNDVTWSKTPRNKRTWLRANEGNKEVGFANPQYVSMEISQPSGVRERLEHEGFYHEGPAEPINCPSEYVYYDGQDFYMTQAKTSVFHGPYNSEGLEVSGDLPVEHRRGIMATPHTIKFIGADDMTLSGGAFSKGYYKLLATTTFEDGGVSQKWQNLKTKQVVTYAASKPAFSHIKLTKADVAALTARGAYNFVTHFLMDETPYIQSISFDEALKPYETSKLWKIARALDAQLVASKLIELHTLGAEDLIFLRDKFEGRSKLGCVGLKDGEKLLEAWSYLKGLPRNKKPRSIELKCDVTGWENLVADIQTLSPSGLLTRGATRTLLQTTAIRNHVIDNDQIERFYPGHAPDLAGLSNDRKLKLLGKLREIRVLNAPDLKAGPGLIKFLENNRWYTLKTLNLEGLKVGRGDNSNKNNAGWRVCQEICKIKSLTSLNMLGTNITNQDTVRLAEGIQKNLTNLRELKLTMPVVHLSLLQYVDRALDSQQTPGEFVVNSTWGLPRALLRTLSADCYDQCDQDSAEVCEFLGKTTSLEKLMFKVHTWGNKDRYQGDICQRIYSTWSRDKAHPTITFLN